MGRSGVTFVEECMIRCESFSGPIFVLRDRFIDVYYIIKNNGINLGQTVTA